MATIPDDKVQEVRDKVDIVDLVGRYVELRRAGRNFKGLCPFHQEKTPSFNVNPQRKGYKCFGCGAGGDAIRFVMELEGKGFPEAIRKLAELYGVSLPSAYGRGGSGASSGAKDEAYAACRIAADLYERILWDDERGAIGRTYLEARGLSDETARTFRLGYAPAPTEGGWDTLVRAIEAERGATGLETAEKLGLVARSERTGNRYDRFRGRLMFPVIAAGGEVIAFSGRIVPPHDEDKRDDRPPPKYINSPESILFTKGKSLFGLATARPAIRDKGRGILVEGNVDVVKLHQWEFGETVAPLGTALTSDQARLLSRFSEQVIMCFDGDQAGKKAAWAALPLLLEADLDVRMVLLPAGEDPDSVGRERLSALIDRARPALEEMMMRIAAKAGEAAHARARGLDRIVPLIAKVPRTSAREIYADRASELFGLPPTRVRAALSSIANRPKSGAKHARGARSPQENSRRFHSTSDEAVPLSAAVRPAPPLPPGQAQLAMLLVDVPHLASVAERSGALECVTDPRLSPIVQAVIEGAKRGEDPSMPDLLDLVDPQHQQQVHEAVFSGEYREDGAKEADPRDELEQLVRWCRRKAIEDEIRDIERRVAKAQDQGYPEEAVKLAQAKLELSRRKDALGHN